MVNIGYWHDKKFASSVSIGTKSWHDGKFASSTGVAFTPGTAAKSGVSAKDRGQDIIKEILAKFKTPEANAYVSNGKISYYSKAPTMFILGSKKK